MGKHQFRLEAEVVQNKLPSSEHKKLAKIADAQVRDNALLLTYIYIYTLQLAAAWKPSLFQDEKKHKSSCHWMLLVYHQISSILRLSTQAVKA